MPLIDRAHRLMQLWKAGDVTKVNAFLDQAGLARDALFAQLVQALIELADHDGKGDEKRRSSNPSATTCVRALASLRRRRRCCSDLPGEHHVRTHR